MRREEAEEEEEGCVRRSHCPKFLPAPQTQDLTCHWTCPATGLQHVSHVR